ncbi:RhoGAP-domain-containing protein, partial [Amniculicola lignicola CBS 123094]
MPNGTPHAPLSAQRARNGEPQPAPPPTVAEPATTKANLTSWWKTFKRGNPKKEEEKAVEPDVRGIFAVPLITSIPYANVAISLFNETGESYIYGYVPIVVAKCGVFLKEKATDVEGIFRLAGSEKRIKELKVAFDTPPRYGKGLDWTGYTVHDAANILRRYFNQLPEPIIPLQHYDPFRQPLRNHQAEAVGQIEGQAPSIGGFDPNAAVRVYQHRIKELPSLNRQLLLYILDLLAVFAAKSDINKMTTSNLAAIFQPGILSHPQHDMSPQDYRLSQDVLIFLIDNQDHFLIGMEGTAIDEGTEAPVAVKSTPPVATGEVKREEKLDVVKSGEEKPAPVEQIQVPTTPAPVSVASPASTDDSTPTPTGPVASNSMSHVLAPPPQQYGSRSPHLTPTRDRSEFIEGPIDNGPTTEMSPAVRTFTQILSKVSPTGEEKDGRKPKKLQKKSRMPSSTNPSAHSSTHSLGGTNPGYEPPSSPPFHATVPHYPPPATSKELPHAFTQDTVSSRHSGTTLKPSMSPSASFRSHSTATEYSEAEPTEEPPKEEKRSFWKSHKRGESRATPTTSQTDLGSVPGAEKSMSSFGSSAGQGRQSLQYDSNHGSEVFAHASAETKEHDKKKPFGNWFREKRQE